MSESPTKAAPVALVTGASRGIGAAIALELAEAEPLRAWREDDRLTAPGGVPGAPQRWVEVRVVLTVEVHKDRRGRLLGDLAGPPRGGLVRAPDPHADRGATGDTRSHFGHHGGGLGGCASHQDALEMRPYPRPCSRMATPM